MRQRLHSRPAWRKSRDPIFIEEQVQFNGWLNGHAEKTKPAIELIDTTGATMEATAEQVAMWIRGKIGYTGSIDEVNERSSRVA